jgi:hypothetical protein
VAGSREHSNEPPCTIKGEEYLIYLSDVSFSRRTVLHGVSYHIDCKDQVSDHKMCWQSCLVFRLFAFALKNWRKPTSG